MTRIAVICARGGSKGVPNKNIRHIGGLPLVSWTIHQALESSEVDFVSVSSDSDEILSIALAAGAQFTVKRPQELATDSISVLPAVRHCLIAAENQIGKTGNEFVYLQPTSPARNVADVTNAIRLFERSKVGSVVSVTEAHSSPYFNLVEKDLNGCVTLSKSSKTAFVRRQDAPKCYELNGSIYVFDRERFLNHPSVLYPDTLIFEMPRDRSIDIDTEFDWKIAELVMSERENTRKLDEASWPC